MRAQVKEFFDSATSTLSYVVYDEDTLDGVIIDPVLDFNLEDSSIHYSSIEKVLDFINTKKLKIHFILDTHIHADHFSGAYTLRESIPEVKIGIGQGVKDVKNYFSKYFDIYNDKPFDLLLQDEEVLSAGSLSIKVLSTPGHTPSCVSYLIGDNVFTGDLIFMPDSGTGRCDFPNGSSKDMYLSIKNKIFTLPKEYKIFTGHDYQVNDRDLKFMSTVGEQILYNIQVGNSIECNEFIDNRNSRDNTLNEPRLLPQSLQVNINGGDISPIKVGNRVVLKGMVK